MPLLSDTLQESYLAYAAIFFCISVGFLSLRLINRKQIGPGHWALGFLSNGLGFVLWSGTVPLAVAAYYLLGEVFHIAGFFFLVAGAYRFTGKAYRRWNFVFLAVWFALWIGSLLLFQTQTPLALFLLRILRALLFALSGTLLLLEGRSEKTIGIPVAGASMLGWGLYIVVYSIFPFNSYLYFGFLVGLQVLAAFGMVAMVLDKIRVRAEQSEDHVKKLEGILPICSYCKNIRDKNNQWHRLEAYIEDRSEAEFTHGICPDCFKKFRPDQR